MSPHNQLPHNQPAHSLPLHTQPPHNQPDSTAPIFANLRFAPRYYQQAALVKFQRALRRNLQNFIFPMATGSGKTFVMAATMLELYRRGYRNFIFFVNSNQILEKTRDNFLHSNSPKYLFQPRILLDGAEIHLHEVTTFPTQPTTDINLIFTTTQRLHGELNRPRENGPTYAELARQDVIMIGDEAHHNNVQTKQQRTQQNWESTVARILADNPRSLLLEFTATLDLDNPAIAKKYCNNIIYRYDLRRMCADKFSKTIQIYSVDDDLPRRELEAVVISEYRRILAEQKHIILKPIVMFKSNTIKVNKTNLTNFHHMIAALEPRDLLELKTTTNPILQQVLNYFDKRSISMKQLCETIQRNFALENLLCVDSEKQLAPAVRRAINTLEAPDNPYRAIFAVDILNEGWDVLNLFDIVRLYEPHDESGKTTIAEAQLIGRGARYYPFSTSQFPELYQRKFDQVDDPLRILEQLFYHTKQDVSYIAEIRQAMRDIGLKLANQKPRARVVSQTPSTARPSKRRFRLPKQVSVHLPSGESRIGELFSSVVETAPSAQTQRYEFDLAAQPENLIQAALNRHALGDFVHQQELGFNSRQEFVSALRQIKVAVESSLAPPYSLDQRLYIIYSVLCHLVL